MRSHFTMVRTRWPLRLCRRRQRLVHGGLNLIPGLNAALYRALQHNDLASGQEIFYKQVDLLRFIVSKGLPRAVHAGLGLMQVYAGHLRKPLLPLSSAEQHTLQALLAACN